MAIKKWISRIGWSSVLLVLFILFFLFIGLRLPFVQSQIGNLASSYLSRKTNTEVEVDKVLLQLFDRVALKDAFFEDTNGDTLLYAEKLTIDINLKKLLRQTVDVDKLILKNSVVNLKQTADSTFNFQHFIDAFANKKEKKKEKQPSKWKIQADKVELTNNRTVLDLISGKQDISVKKLDVHLKEIDINTLTFDAKSIAIDDVSYQANFSKNNPNPKTKQYKQIDFPLETIPVVVKADELKIKNSFVDIITGTDSALTNQFNPQRIYAADLNLDFKDVRVDSSQAVVQVEQLTTNFGDFIQLENLSGALNFAALETSAKNLSFNTTRSIANMNASLNYTNFNELTEFKNTLDIEVNGNPISVDKREIFYFTPSLRKITAFEALSNKIDLNATINGRPSNLNIQKLAIVNGNSVLDVKGNIQNITDVDALNLNNLAIDLASDGTLLQKFVGDKIDVASLGKVNVATILNGNLASLDFKELDVNSEQGTNLLANGNIKNLHQPKNLRYDLEVRNAETSTAALNAIVGQLPDIANKLEQVSFNGKLLGTTKEFSVNGLINSNLGKAYPNIDINFNDNFTDATYNGSFKTEGFELGKLLDQKDIGAVSLIAKVDGNGLQLKDIDANIKATIQSAIFKDHEYKNVVLKGDVKDATFDGKLNLKDKYGNVALDGKVGFNNKTPTFDVVIAADSINLEKLNLTKQPLIVSGNIQSDIKGGNINDLLGEATITNFKLHNGDKTWEDDSVAISISENGNTKTVQLESSVAKAKMEGQIDLQNLAANLMYDLDKYISVSNQLNIKAKPAVANEQNFKAFIQLKNAENLAQVLSLPLEKLDTATISMTYNPNDSLIDIKGDVNEFKYTNISAKNVELESNTIEGKLVVEADADSFKMGGAVFFDEVVAKISAKDGKGQYSVEINDENQEHELGMSGAITADENGFSIGINDNLILNNQVWNLALKEPLVLGKKVTLPAFNLIRDDQGILLSKTNADGDLEFYFESFEMSNITDILLSDSIELDGSINGSLLIAPSKDPMTIEGDVFVSTIQYNGVDMGNLSMRFENIAGAYTTASINLQDLYTDVNVEAILSEGNSIDSKVNINQFDMKALSPFLKNIIEDVEGGMEGYVTIGGNLNAPEINGLVDMQNVKAKIKALNSTYSIETGNVEIEKDNIYSSITFVDSLERKAFLTGYIYHQYFKDINFDMKLKADEFTFLDSEANDKLPFYGKLNAQIDANLTGPLQQPKINTIFATKDSTEITINPFTNQRGIQNEDFVIFVDGSNYSTADIDSIISLKFDFKTNFDITAFANIHKKTKLNVIIDPLTGGGISVQGYSNLVVDVTENGELLINGIYEVEGGSYIFTYQDLFLKKRFDIVKGGTITFVGNIMDSRIDVSAVHKVATSTYSLVQNEFETLSQQEQTAVRKPTEVDVLVNILGSLSSPELVFDIELPETSGNLVSSSVSRTLDKLRTNTNELNTQVFSLLLLGGFTSSNLASNVFNSGTQIAYNSVTSFINNQLRKLTSKAKGLEVDIGLSSTSNGELSSSPEDSESTNFGASTNIDAAIKYSILNDRLSFKIGGNIDLNSGNSSGSLTNVAGDFVLEYSITKDGNLRLNVFQKTNYSILNNSNVWRTGVGISYQKAFSKIELKNNRKKRKEEKRKKRLEKSKAIENKDSSPSQE